MKKRQRLGLSSEGVVKKGFNRRTGKKTVSLGVMVMIASVHLAIGWCFLRIALIVPSNKVWRKEAQGHTGVSSAVLQSHRQDALEVYSFSASLGGNLGRERAKRTATWQTPRIYTCILGFSNSTNPKNQYGHFGTGTQTPSDPPEWSPS